MKRLIVLITVLMLLLSTSVSAKQVDNFSITLDEETYAVLAKDEINSKKELVESLGYTPSSLKKYFEDNGLILFATTADKSRQVQIKCSETEFTRQLSDLAALDNDKSIDVAKKILPEEIMGNYLLINKGDIMLYQFAVKSADSGGEFCSRQYVTICDGKLYSIAFFESGSQLSSEFSMQIDGMMNTLKIKRDGKLTAKNAEDITVMVIIWVLIGIAAVIAGVMIYSLVKDLLGRDKTEEERLVINRRKYKK